MNIWAEMDMTISEMRERLKFGAEQVEQRIRVLTETNEKLRADLAAAQRRVKHLDELRRLANRAPSSTWEWTQRKQLDLDKPEGAAP